MRNEIFSYFKQKPSASQWSINCLYSLHSINFRLKKCFNLSLQQTLYFIWFHFLRSHVHLNGVTIFSKNCFILRRRRFLNRPKHSEFINLIELKDRTLKMFFLGVFFLWWFFGGDVYKIGTAQIGFRYLRMYFGLSLRNNHPMDHFRLILMHKHLLIKHETVVRSSCLTSMA